MQITILPRTNMYKGTRHVRGVVPACHQLFCFNRHKEASRHPEFTGEETGTEALSDLSKVTHPGSGEHRTGSRGVPESASAESGHLFPTPRSVSSPWELETGHGGNIYESAKAANQFLPLESDCKHLPAQR